MRKMYHGKVNWRREQFDLSYRLRLGFIRFLFVVECVLLSIKPVFSLLTIEFFGKAKCIYLQKEVSRCLCTSRIGIIAYCEFLEYSTVDINICTLGFVLEEKLPASIQ